MKTFAVIIPTFNEEENIALFLADIAKQSLKPDQVIVADAKSTDRTRAVALESGAEIVDGGLPGPGRNAGARIAKTDILFFMDADVRLFDERFFEKAVGEFTLRHLGSATAELEPMSKRWDDYFGHWIYNKLLRRQAKSSPYAAGSLIIATREVHELIRGFDEAVLLGEDTDYATRASHVALFGILDSVKIPVSVRRLERDGRVRTAIKYVLAGFHQAVFGPIKHDRFKYEFGYDHMKKKSSTQRASRK